MLRVTQNSSASGTTKYFFGYYSEVGLDIAKWHGKGAEKLGLSGEIQERDFDAISHNINPQTGEQLTARNAKNRTVGYDFTFSVPKSVSVVFALTKDKEIIEAFNTSIEKTMVEIENGAETRVRDKGKSENRNTGNLVWGTFTHGESRPVEGVPDPHLHQHVFIFNATHDPKEKKWKAGQFRNLKANAPYFETVFNSHFADDLQNVGYQVERDNNTFQLKNFERSTIEKFSNRTKQIEDKANELGLTYTEDKALLGAKTRAKKLKNLDRSELQYEWKSRLTEKEIALVYGSKNSPPDGGVMGIKKSLMGEKKKELTVKQALDYSLAHNLERKSTVPEKDIYIHALRRSYGSVSPNELSEELASRKDLLSKEDKAGNKIFTTQKALKEENQLKQSAREGRGKLKPINNTFTIKNDNLTPEQANAVQHVLNSKDFITIVSGGAGTGKTWSIKEVAEGIKEKGINLGAFAPSSVASRQVQRDDGFKNATTIAELLKNKKLQSSLKDGVLWVDEAGLVGNKTMNSVIDIANEQNARILLTGDIKQHNSVERGDALRIIQKYGGVQPARISKIQRQKVEGYKKAIRDISDGEIETGFMALDNMGAIKEAGDFGIMKQNAADDYVASVKAKENVLMVATTHAQGRAVTETIRSQLKEEGIISKKEEIIQIQKNLGYTKAQKTDITNYQKGMSVQFHQNVKGGFKRGGKYDITGKDDKGNVLLDMGDIKDKTTTLPFSAINKFSVYEKEKLTIAKGDKIRITQNGFSKEKMRINNGNILSIKDFDKEGNIIASTGKREMTLPKDFGNLTHGYYTTSPASQGKSVNKVIILQGSMSGKATSKEQFYVSASRGKFEISIHTDDKEHLLSSVQRSTQRVTATDIAKAHKEVQNKQTISIKDKLKKIGSIYKTISSKLVKLKVDKKQKSRDNTVLKLKPKPEPKKQIAHGIPRKGR